MIGLDKEDSNLYIFLLFDESILFSTHIHFMIILEMDLFHHIVIIKKKKIIKDRSYFVTQRVESWCSEKLFTALTSPFIARL